MRRNGSADAACARQAARQFGVIARYQALGHGLTSDGIRRRLASGQLRHTRHRGVYVYSGAPSSWEQDLTIARLWAGPGAVVSHRSAAAVLGLEGFRSGVIEISTPRNLRSSSRGVVVHYVPPLLPDEVAVVHGIPVTTVDRTLVDLAAVVPITRVERALDDALRRRLVTIEGLGATLARMGSRGRAGAGRLVKVLEARAGRAPVESALEERFLALVLQAGLPPPDVQHVVREGGRVLARIDFAYPEQRVAIELDGFRYHSDRLSWERDRSRANALVCRGWRLLHFTDSDVKHRMAHVAAEVRRMLRLPDTPYVIGR